MSNFYLCRHGQTVWNSQRILQGHLESELTQKGVEQAYALAKQANSWDIDLVVSSHLKRAKHTASICAEFLSVEHHTYNDIAERNFANWQGQKIAEIDGFREFRESCYKFVDNKPNEAAESTREVRNRFQSILEEIAKQQSVSANILVVSHGDALDCVLSQWTHPQYLKNGQYVVLKYSDEQFHIDALPVGKMSTTAV